MRNNIFLAAAGAAVMVMAASCSTSKNINIDELSGRWEVKAVDGKEVKMTAEDAAVPYLGFDVINGKLTGNAGCNRIMGSFTTTEPAGVISFGNINSTRMMCPDMSVEQSILQALGKVKGYHSDASGDVTLTGENGSGLLLLKKIKADINPSELNGTWKIKELNGNTLAPAEDAEYTITFDPGQQVFSCNTGCNTLGGNFSAEYSDFNFDLSTSTMMMCPDTTVEDMFKEILPTVTSYGHTDSGIVFYSDTATPVLVITK